MILCKWQPLCSFANITYWVSCTRHFHKHILVDPHNSLRQYLCPFQKWVQWSLEKWSNLFRSHKLVRRRARIQICWLFVQVYHISNLLFLALTATTWMLPKLSIPIFGLWINWRESYFGWGQKIDLKFYSNFIIELLNPFT